MKAKKLLAIFTIMVMLVALCGCGGTKAPSGATSSNSVAQQSSPSETLKLLFCEKDGFNPYTCVSKMNKEITLLMFDALFHTDNEFNTVNVMAENYELKGKELNVTLKDSIKFSDGSPVSAEDIVFSFGLAKKSTTSDFTARLASLVSCKAVGERAVCFTLSKVDEYAVNLLDFPIIKRGTTELKNADNVALPPIGCGRYIYNSIDDTLVPNPFYNGSFSIKKIILTNAPDNESAKHSIEVGNTDIYYHSLVDSESVRMYSSRRKLINTTNLVYIGANCVRGITSNEELRYAVSAALDRNELVYKGFNSAAVAATGIYHPYFKPAMKLQTIQTSANEQITIVNLKQIGYNKRESDGIFVNSKGKTLSFSILANSENPAHIAAADCIVAQLKSAGFNVTLRAVGYSSYISALKNGQFDFYLGEICFNPNMDITALVYPGAAAAFGVAPKATQETDGVTYRVWQILDKYYAGKASIADVINIFESELSAIPICYLSAGLFYDQSLANEPGGSASDIYMGINSYTFKEDK